MEEGMAKEVGRRAFVSAGTGAALLVSLRLSGLAAAKEGSSTADEKGSGVDLTSMTIDELMSLKEELDLEIASRPDGQPMQLPSGEYLVGTDIPAGRYTLSFLPGDEDIEDDLAFTNYYVYESKSMYDYDASRLWLGDMPLDEGSVRTGSTASVALREGNVFSLHYNGAGVSRTGNVEPLVSDYTAPDGTDVPPATYAVGDEIPEGSYDVYYNGTSTARFRVYENADDAGNDFADPKFEVVLNQEKTNTTVNGLAAGEFVKVEYNDVIMKKGEGLVFD